MAAAGEGDTAADLAEELLPPGTLRSRGGLLLSPKKTAMCLTVSETHPPTHPPTWGCLLCGPVPLARHPHLLCAPVPAAGKAPTPALPISPAGKVPTPPVCTPPPLPPLSRRPVFAFSTLAPHSGDVTKDGRVSFTVTAEGFRVRRAERGLPLGEEGMGGPSIWVRRTWEDPAFG